MRINIPAGRNPHPALNHGSKIGDDVPEHIVRNDHIEPFGVLDEPHRGGIHVGIVALDIRVILLADLVKRAFPQVESIGQHVRLSAEREFFFLVALAGEVEGKS